MADPATEETKHHGKRWHRKHDKHETKAAAVDRNAPLSEQYQGIGIPFTDLDAQYGLPIGTLASLKVQESVPGDGSHAVSSQGARKDFQYMPGSRQQCMEDYGIDPWSSPRAGATCAAKDLTAMCTRNHWDLKTALAGYNAGEYRIQKTIRKHGAQWLDHVTPETQAFADQVMARLEPHATPYKPEMLQEVIVAKAPATAAPAVAQSAPKPAAAVVTVAPVEVSTPAPKLPTAEEKEFTTLCASLMERGVPEPIVKKITLSDLNDLRGPMFAALVAYAGCGSKTEQAVAVRMPIVSHHITKNHFPSMA